MTNSWKFNAIFILIMWINITKECLVLYPVKKIWIYEEQEARAKRTQKFFAELRKNRTSLYEEEQEIRAEEPDFFAGSEITEPLLEDNILDKNIALGEEEYPEYPPPQADSDYDFSEIESATGNTLQLEKEDYYGEEYEDYHEKYFPLETREKRDTAEILHGVLNAGEKLLNGNMVGSLTSFLTTLAKPIYSYFIKSDNDHAMTRFTHRVVPETGFGSSPKAIEISRAAREGNGEEVWHRLSADPRQWNPRSLYKNDRFHQSDIHRECRRNLPLIDRNLKNRLREVSLLMTSLVTSLHDTTVADLNKGFKEATAKFDKITETTDKILKSTSSDKDAKTVIDLMENTAKMMIEVAGGVADNTWTITDISMAGVTILFTGILTILLIKVIRDNKVITEENKLILDEIKKLQLPESGQDRNQEDQTLRNTVMIAVAEAMEV